MLPPLNKGHEAYQDAIQRRKDARKRVREKKKEQRENSSRDEVIFKVIRFLNI